jgi:hypothetical protein
VRREVDSPRSRIVRGAGVPAWALMCLIRTKSECGETSAAWATLRECPLALLPLFVPRGSDSGGGRDARISPGASTCDTGKDGLVAGEKRQPQGV